MKEIAANLHRSYPDEKDFAASTAAARINGYLGGHGDAGRLAGEIDGFGLDAPARAALERIVRQMHPSESCRAPSSLIR